MQKSKKSKDERELEVLAKKLLSMPHKPREDSKVGGANKIKKRLTKNRKRG